MKLSTCLLVLLLLPVTSPLAAAEEESPETSGPIDFTMTGVRGESISLASHRGLWVVVNYWATWCKPCRKEIPDLSALHDEREDVHVIGLAFEEVEAPAILAFLEEYPASYPIALVDVFEPPEAFGYPMVLPTTILVSPTGHKANTFVGPVTREDIEAWISDNGAGE